MMGGWRVDFRVCVIQWDWNGREERVARPSTGEYDREMRPEGVPKRLERWREKLVAGRKETATKRWPEKVGVWQAVPLVGAGKATSAGVTKGNRKKSEVS
jgi:hypothetical protein